MAPSMRPTVTTSPSLSAARAMSSTHSTESAEVVSLVQLKGDALRAESTTSTGQSMRSPEATVA